MICIHLTGLASVCAQIGEKAAKCVNEWWIYAGMSSPLEDVSRNPWNFYHLDLILFTLGCARVSAIWSTGLSCWCCAHKCHSKVAQLNQWICIGGDPPTRIACFRLRKAIISTFVSEWLEENKKKMGKDIALELTYSSGNRHHTCFQKQQQYSRFDESVLIWCVRSIAFNGLQFDVPGRELCRCCAVSKLASPGLH